MGQFCHQLWLFPAEREESRQYNQQDFDRRELETLDFFIEDSWLGKVL